MRLRFLAFAAALLAVALVFVIPRETDLQTERKAYEQFLREHPYAQREPISKEELKSMPKKDRPDLAAEQQFLLTMDPDTKTIPFERLIEANQIATSLKRGGGGSAVTEEWEDRGPTNVGGRTRAVMFDPNDPDTKKVWAGGVGGGLWYTDDITDPGAEWTSVDDFWGNLAVSAITHDPTDSDVYYVGTGEGWFNIDAIQGAGIFKTEDAGATWQLLESTTGSQFRNVQDVLVHPTTGDVYAATREAGLQRSQDGGLTWQTVLAGTGVGIRASDLELGADGRIYATFGIFTNGGVFVSESGDFGSWTNLSQSPGFPASGYQRVQLATAPSDANVLYAALQNTSGGLLGVYRSEDVGETWEQLPMPGHPQFPSDPSNGQAWYDLIVQVHPDDADTVYLGAIDVHRSSDGGQTWELMSSGYGLSGVPNMHVDQHNIVFRPGFSDEAVFSHDGGITYSPDVTLPIAELDLVNRNNGYNVTQYYTGALNPGAGSHVMLAGAQDNGTQRYSQEGFGFTNSVLGGDGASTFIDQDAPALAIASTQFINYRRSTNGGVTFSGTLLQVSGGSFINPAAYDDRENILYVNYTGTSFYRVSNVQGAPVIAQVPIALGGVATHLRVSPHAPEGTSTVFLGTQAGRIFKVSNAQATDLGEVVIDELNTPWPSMAISSIEIGHDEDHLLVTSSNYGPVSIWETYDGGETWADREGNLPDIPVRWALFHPEAVGGVALIATEAGVWETTNLGSAEPEWNPSPSFPTVSTYMLQWRPSDNTVMAATHGRGVFTTKFLEGVVDAEENATPQANELTAAYPNPFADRATFSLRLDEAQPVRVELYDVRGRRVATLHDGPLSASEHRFEIDGSGLTAGTYLYVVSGESFRDEGRVTLVR